MIGTRFALVVVISTFGGLISQANAALGTAITYQGQLKQSGNAYSGTADFVFLLYDASAGGIVQGLPVSLNGQTVAGGLFTVELDFGVNPYTTNDARWLEISVRAPSGVGAFTTLSPRQKLTAAPFSLATRGLNVDADGNVEGASGAAFGNDGNVGLGAAGSLWAIYDAVLDFSHTLTDFSSNENWTPFRSIITVDPDADLPMFTGIYAHDLETWVPPTNDKDIWYLQGPYVGTIHDGSGHTETLGGALTFSRSRGDVTYQVGHSVQSYAGGSGSITWNTGLEVLSGHYGVDGEIGDNFGLYIWQPDHNRPISNNFGLYIEDQDVADASNYAIYAAGGETYLNGDVQSTGRVAIGNDANLGINGFYDNHFDLSQVISDFSSSPDWDPYRFYLTIDPTIDLTGADATYIYGHDLIAEIPAGNPHDIATLTGPYLGVFHDGSGTVDGLTAAVINTETKGNAIFQSGASIFSTGENQSVIFENFGLYIASGHQGGGGAIATDYSVFIGSPDHGGPLTNHYGLYLQDQDFGLSDSYAIYSAGGDVYFNGDLEVTGNISKGGGSFKIDHPLDPENKYLYHSFVESPDMMNVYNGNITTDGEGYAVVNMPDWFEALNRDFRYQLTVIGQFAQAIVAEKMHDNQFVIRTDKPNVEVSWQVTGIRQDAFANENRIPVEVDKSESERGKLLHPAAFGQPDHRRIGHKEPTADPNPIRERSSVRERTRNAEASAVDPRPSRSHAALQTLRKEGQK